PPSAKPRPSRPPPRHPLRSLPVSLSSLRRHDPDQVRRVRARKRTLSPSDRGSPVSGMVPRFAQKVNRPGFYDPAVSDNHAARVLVASALALAGFASLGATVPSAKVGRQTRAGAPPRY